MRQSSLNDSCIPGQMDYSFSFRVTLAHPGVDPETCVPALHREGCQDALVGMGFPGILGLAFVRSAPTLPMAVASAHAAVKRAIPDALGVEVLWGRDIIRPRSNE